MHFFFLFNKCKKCHSSLNHLFKICTSVYHSEAFKMSFFSKIFWLAFIILYFCIISHDSICSARHVFPSVYWLKSYQKAVGCPDTIHATIVPLSIFCHYHCSHDSQFVGLFTISSSPQQSAYDRSQCKHGHALRHT